MSEMLCKLLSRPNNCPFSEKPCSETSYLDCEVRREAAAQANEIVLNMEDYWKHMNSGHTLGED